MTYFRKQAQNDLYNDVTINIYFLEESVLRSYYIRKNDRKSVPSPVRSHIKNLLKFINFHHNSFFRDVF